jgi:aspartate carbamoyltransferase catalytic subunit
MPSKVCDVISSAGHSLTITQKLEGLVEADICYQTRIQEERFATQEQANQFRGKFRLNQQIYTQHFKSQTVIMHPLPRDSRAEANELDNDLNVHPNLAIFRQTDNGVLVRMALFALTLGVHNIVKDYDRSVHWFSNKGAPAKT